MEQKLSSTSPPWFVKCIKELHFQDRYLEHDTCQIHYQLFEAPDHVQSQTKPIVVLVHGGGAHSRWWDWTAPFLAKDGYVVACIDMSGQGDSDTRPEYTMEINALEVMSVARVTTQEFSKTQKPVIIGHSFGGYVTLLCGQKHGDELSGIVVLDSAIRPADHPDNLQPPPMKKKKKGTKTLAELRSRFKLMPPQPTKNQYLMDYIFPHSVRKDRDQIVWKDDPLRFQKMVGKMETLTPTDINQFVQTMSQRLRNIQCRLTVCWAEHSIFFQDPSIEAHMKQELEGYPPKGQTSTPFIMVPDSYHHLMFDQPRMMVTILRTILSEWHAADTGTGGRDGGTCTGSGGTGSGSGTSRNALHVQVNMSKM